MPLHSPHLMLDKHLKMFRLLVVHVQEWLVLRIDVEFSVGLQQSYYIVVTIPMLAPITIYGNILAIK